ncbi:MAG: hypothetical protein H6Q67_393 [Firmicutes bacterium]|nr:hypothetical protein [Bacillota bacterium]
MKYWMTQSIKVKQPDINPVLKSLLTEIYISVSINKKIVGGEELKSKYIVIITESNGKKTRRRIRIRDKPGKPKQ